MVDHEPSTEIYRFMISALNWFKLKFGLVGRLHRGLRHNSWLARSAVQRSTFFGILHQ